jgi:hypothetical protein
LKNGFKIAGIILFNWICLTASSQIEKGLIPWSNKFLLNPSYAGFEKNTHLWSNLQFNAQPQKNLNNTWSLTYDTWLEKMEGGFSVRFYQGLEGKFNTATTGAGFSFSKSFDAGRNGQLIPSVGLSLQTAEKQWFVHFIDRAIDRNLEHQSPPGEEFLRYSVSQPSAGLLWNSVSAEIGLASYWFLYRNYGEEEDVSKQSSLFLIFHATKKRKGNRRGLVSQPVKTSPELTVIYAEDLILSRVGIRLERTGHQFGIFAQNNYSQNIHGIGGAFGWKINNIRLNFSAGGSYSIPDNIAGFFGEVSLGLVIPYIHINEINPWAPPPRLF